MHWYEIDTIEKIDSPSLIVYASRAKENIDSLIKMVGGNVDQLRPHVKTNKIAQVCQMMMDEGIRHYKCATIAEAEMLGLLKAHNVLIAHQLMGPKLNRLVALIKSFPGTKFSCLIDNIETATSVSNLFGEAGLKIDVYMDVNIGMNRSGIITDKATTLFKAAASLSNIKIIGLHCYDGHIRETNISSRNAQADAAFENADQLRKNIEASTSSKLELIVAGSCSFSAHIKRKDVQVSPGTFVFWDWGYKNLFPDLPFEFAALVVTRIISIIDEHTLCTDLGHKAVAAENPMPRVHFLNAPDAEPVGQSEEHLVVKVQDASKYKVGDVWYGVPVHICPTVALYDNALIVNNNKVVDEWEVVARKRKITI
jgi:D-serine deaminase-like pyridoxal phosphate-dependent protein